MASALDDCIYCSPFLGVLSLDRLIEQHREGGSPFDVLDPAPDIPDVLDCMRTCIALHRAVNNLPERQQAAIRALYFREQTVVQTAGTLRISSAAVVKLHAKALRRLRATLNSRRGSLFA